MVQAQIVDSYSEQILEQKKVSAETLLKLSQICSAAFLNIIFYSLRRMVLAQNAPYTTNKGLFWRFQCVMVVVRFQLSCLQETCNVSRDFWQALLHYIKLQLVPCEMHNSFVYENFVIER